MLVRRGFKNLPLLAVEQLLGGQRLCYWWKAHSLRPDFFEGCGEVSLEPWLIEYELDAKIAGPLKSLQKVLWRVSCRETFAAHQFSDSVSESGKTAISVLAKVRSRLEDMERAPLVQLLVEVVDEAQLRELVFLDLKLTCELNE